MQAQIAADLSRCRGFRKQRGWPGSESRSRRADAARRFSGILEKWRRSFVSGRVNLFRVCSLLKLGAGYLLLGVG